MKIIKDKIIRYQKKDTEKFPRLFRTISIRDAIKMLRAREGKENQIKNKNMKVVLIYDDGEEYEPCILVREFDSESEMIDFINKENKGNSIISAYEFYKKIKIIPVEKVTKWEISSK